MGADAPLNTKNFQFKGMNCRKLLGRLWDPFKSNHKVAKSAMRMNGWPATKCLVHWTGYGPQKH